MERDRESDTDWRHHMPEGATEGAAVAGFFRRGLLGTVSGQVRVCYRIEAVVRPRALPEE